MAGKGGPKGNNYGTKLKHPDVRQEAYRQYCDYLAQGNSKEGWKFQHPEFSCTFKTMEKYIRENPLEFPIIKKDLAEADSFRVWEQRGISMPLSIFGKARFVRVKHMHHYGGLSMRLIAVLTGILLLLLALMTALSAIFSLSCTRSLVLMLDTSGEKGSCSSKCASVTSLPLMMQVLNLRSEDARWLVPMSMKSQLSRRMSLSCCWAVSLLKEQSSLERQTPTRLIIGSSSGWTAILT
jgi:hypothetical protein